jgi:hypothetical protein
MLASEIKRSFMFCREFHGASFGKKLRKKKFEIGQRKFEITDVPIYSGPPDIHKTSASSGVP